MCLRCGFLQRTRRRSRSCCCWLQIRREKSLSGRRVGCGKEAWRSAGWRSECCCACKYVRLAASAIRDVPRVPPLLVQEYLSRAIGKPRCPPERVAALMALQTVGSVQRAVIQAHVDDGAGVAPSTDRCARLSGAAGPVSVRVSCCLACVHARVALAQSGSVYGRNPVQAPQAAPHPSHVKSSRPASSVQFDASARCWCELLSQSACSERLSSGCTGTR
jgi:hypothetical protein